MFAGLKRIASFTHNVLVVQALTANIGLREESIRMYTQLDAGVRPPIAEDALAAEMVSPDACVDGRHATSARAAAATSPASQAAASRREESISAAAHGAFDDNAALLESPLGAVPVGLAAASSAAEADIQQGAQQEDDRMAAAIVELGPDHVTSAGDIVP